MKLYTFQRMHVWETLQDLGYYHPYHLFEHNSFLQDDFRYPWGFAQSYLWLRQAMLNRNIHYTAANEHLIWAWYQWNGPKKMNPDKRYASVFDYFDNEPYVLLELDIDPARVALSDYDLWHFVLNYSYIGSRRECNKFSKVYNHYRFKGKDLNPEGQLLLENTWHNIFDFEKSRKFLEISKKQQRIQATFFELFYSDITKVHFFEHKKCQKVEVLRP